MTGITFAVIALFLSIVLLFKLLQGLTRGRLELDDRVVAGELLPRPASHSFSLLYVALVHLAVLVHLIQALLLRQLFGLKSLLVRVEPLILRKIRPLQTYS